MIRSAPTASDLLREGTRTLREASNESPGLDAEILLRESLGATREQLFDALPCPVQGDVAQVYRELIARRVDGVPVAYIIGRREFYGHSFVVDQHVLVPRPETEYLAEYSLSWLKNHSDQSCRFVDVGTGSGAIAISVALETSPDHAVFASEVSLDALEVARINRDALNAEVALVAGSLLNWCTGPVDIIAANLPYLRVDQAHPGIEHEPAIALYAGDDGFALNQILLQQAAEVLAVPGSLIMEIDPSQAQLALDTARARLPDARSVVKADLAGTGRYLIVVRS